MKPRAKRCLGVDIGSTSLKVAELSQDRTGVIIQRLIEAPLDVSPDTPSEARWAAIAQTLRDTLRQNKISTRQAAFALPGHAVFVRRVRLPRTSEERLERIIRFEARQQIPFPLEQTLLQYQIAPTEMDDEVEVLLVAIKREIVEHYMGMIRKLGLRAIRIGVSSFGLFNFYMFDDGVKPQEFDLHAPIESAPEEIPEEEESEMPPPPDTEVTAPKKAGLMDSLKGMFAKKGKKKPAKGEAEEEPEAEAEPADFEGLPEIEEVKAYVNIGASTIDLAIGRAGTSRLIGFSRSIPLAGNQLTKAIQDRCNCESYAEAERIKCEHTQVLPAGTTAGPQQNEEACRAIMPVIDRMVAEIRRSLDFYISQPDGMAVDRMVLSGGQAVLPNLAEYLEDRLAVPVEIAKEIKNPTCRSNLKADVDITNFLISIGLAIQGLGEACISIDFLPEHLKGWIEFKRKNLQLVVQLALVGAMIFIASQIGSRMSTLYDQVATEMRMERESRIKITELFASGQNKRNELFTLILFLTRSNSNLSGFGVSRDFFFKMIQTVLGVRPADVFLSRVLMGPNGELQIDAFLDSNSPKSAPVMTQAIEDLDVIDKAKLTQTAVPDPSRRGRTGLPLYRFQITGQIKDKRSKITLTPTPTRMPFGSGYRRTPPVGGQPVRPTGPSPDDES